MPTAGPTHVTIACFRHNGHHVFYAAHLVRGLQREGVGVSVIGSPEFIDGLRARTSLVGLVKAVPYSSTRPETEWEKIRKAKAAFGFARAHGAEVLHFLNIDGYLPSLRPFTRRSRAPAVCGTLHWLSSVAGNGGGVLGPAKARLRAGSFKALQRAGMRVHVHAPGFIESLAERGGRHVDYVPFPIEFDRPPQLEAAARRAWRGRYGIGLKDRVLLAFGFTNRYKAPDLAIRALRRLPPQYHLVVAGPQGDLTRDLLTDLAKEEGVSNRVHLDLRFLPMDETATAFLASDVVVVPHRQGFSGESGPLTLAIATGRPVVASDHPAFRQTVQDYKAGRTFPPEDVESLAAAVEATFRDPARVDAEKFWLEHSPEAFTRAVVESYRRALQQRTGASKALTVAAGSPA